MHAYGCNGSSYHSAVLTPTNRIYTSIWMTFIIILFLFEFLATKPKDLNKDEEHTETDLTDAADRNNERENTNDDGI